MGFYLETKESTSKALQLKRDHGAQVVIQPRNMGEVPSGKVLICVVENPVFDAAGIVYDQKELDRFSETYTSRPRTWMLMDVERVVELSPHLAEYLRGELGWRD